MRIFSLFLAAVLVVVAPGLPAYHAFAQSIRGPVVVGEGSSAMPLPFVPETPGLGASIETLAVDPVLGTLSLQVLDMPLDRSAAAAATNAASAAARSRSLGASRALRASIAAEVSNLATRRASREPLHLGRTTNRLNRTFDRSSVAASSVQVEPGTFLGEKGAGTFSPAASFALMNAAPEPNEPSGQPTQTPKAAPKTGIVVALGALAGVGAYFAAPMALAAVVGYLPAPVAALAAAHPLVTRVALTSLGAIVGLGFSQVPMWKAYPSRILDGTKTAGQMTFRFWARFGLIFNAVIRGLKPQDAMKAPIYAAFWKYPVFAWPTVIIGYPFAVVAGVLGAAYTIVETPLLAAFRGLKQLVVEFFPWLMDFLEAAVRMVRRILANIVPFVLGFIGGAFVGFGVTAWASATFLAAPFMKAGLAEHEAETVPGWAAVRLAQGLLLLGGVVAGALGLVLGAVLSPAYLLTNAFHTAFRASDIRGRVRGFLDRWRESLEREVGLGSMQAPSFEAAPVDARTSFVRLLNLVARVPYAAVATVLYGVVAYLRAVVRGFTKVPERAAETAQPSTRASAPETPEEAKPEEKPRFLVPFVFWSLGAAAGVLGYLRFLAPSLALTGWLGWAALAAAGIAGAGLALSATQASAWKGYLPSIVLGGRDALKESLRIWKESGNGAASALLGRKTGSSLRIFSGLAFLVLALPSLALGAGAALVATPVAAGWRGFVSMLEGLLPFLRRVFNFIERVLRNVVPFVAGLVAGFIKGIFVGAVVYAEVVIRPFLDLGEERVEDLDGWPFAGIMLLRFVGFFVMAATAIAAFVIGLIPSAIFLAPVMSVSAALRWSKASERGRKYFNAWEDVAIEREADRFKTLTADITEDASPASFISYAARGLQILLLTPVQLLASLLTGVVSIVRSFKNVDQPAPDQPSKPWTQRPEVPKSEKMPFPEAPLVVVMALALAGLAGGAYLGFAFGAPALALAGWKFWTAVGLSGVVGLGLGLALSRPEAWVELFRSAKERGGIGAKTSYALADRAGKAFASVLGLSDRAGHGHRALGFVTAGLVATTGALYGAALPILRASIEAAQQVVDDLLPFLRRVWNFAVRVAKKIFPFLFGLGVGLIGGVIGSMAFGAILLGRPYFKYVATESYQGRGVLTFLGRASLRVLSFLAGVIFSVLGLAAGVIVAAPYALAFSFATALRWGDVSGKTRRLIDHWIQSGLPRELKRLNALTDSFDFDEKRDHGRIELVYGWIRFANILPATIASFFAAMIGGYTAFVRSMLQAWKEVKAGTTAPDPDLASFDVALDRAGRWGWKGMRALPGWTAAAAVAGVIFWLELGFLGSVGLILGAFLGGGLVGLMVGALLGLIVGLASWLSRPEPESKP